MARPIPISNQKSKDWNDFLVYFNQQAANELPKENGQTKWDLLDKNEKFGNYQGGQDYYKQKYADFAASKGWGDSQNHLQESDFPVIQKLYTDIYSAGQQDPQYYNNILLPKLQAQGIDPTNFNPGATMTGKQNTEGWVGSVSRNFLLPMDVHVGSGGASNGAQNFKALVVPGSFNEGESYYKKNAGGTGFQFHDQTTFADGGEIKLGGGEPNSGTHDITTRDGLQSYHDELLTKLNDEKNKNNSLRENLIASADKFTKFEDKDFDKLHKLKDGEYYCNTRACEVAKDAGYDIPLITGPQGMKKKFSEMGFKEIPKGEEKPGDFAQMYQKGVPTHTAIYSGGNDKKYEFYAAPGEKDKYSKDSWDKDVFQKGSDWQDVKFYRHVGKEDDLQKEYDQVKTRLDQFQEPVKGVENKVQTDIKKEIPLYRYGGKIKCASGAELDTDDKSFEILDGGSLKKIVGDIYEAKGRDHEDGGIDIKAGGKDKEIQGGEIVHFKDGIARIVSNERKDPETGKIYSEEYKAKATELAEMKKKNFDWARAKARNIEGEMETIWEKHEKTRIDDGDNKAPEGDAIPITPDKPPTIYVSYNDNVYTFSDPEMLNKFKEKAGAGKFEEFTDKAPEGYTPGTERVFTKQGKLQKVIASEHQVNNATEKQGAIELFPVTVTGQKKNEVANIKQSSINISALSGHSGSLGTKSINTSEYSDYFTDKVKEFEAPKVNVSSNDPYSVSTTGTSPGEGGGYAKESKNLYDNTLKKAESTVTELGGYRSVLKAGDNYINSVLKGDESLTQDWDYIKSAARKMQDSDNTSIGDGVINVLKDKESDLIDSYYKTLTVNSHVPDIYNQLAQTSMFRDELDKTLDGEIKDSKGKVWKLNDLDGSQKEEIRNYVINHYAAKKNFETAVGRADYYINGDEAQDPELIKTRAAIQREYGVDVTTLKSETEWLKILNGFNDEAGMIGDKYAKLVADIPNKVTVNKSYFDAKIDIEMTDATNNIVNKLGSLQQDLTSRTQRDPSDPLYLDPEVAQNMYDEAYKKGLTDQQAKGSEIFNKWNRDYNQQVQTQLNIANDALKSKFQDEIIKAAKNAGLEGYQTEDILRNASDYSKLVQHMYGEVVGDQQAYLDKAAKETADFKDRTGDTWGRITESLNRGTLQMFESLGGGIKWLGGFEAGNVLTDMSAEFNAQHPMIKMDVGLDPLNKDYWIERAVPMLPMLATMTAASLATGGVASGVAGTLGLAGTEATVFTGLVGGGASRVFEGFLEAGDTFQTSLEKGFNIDEAADRAARVYGDNMWLVLTDAFQTGLVFSKGIKMGAGKYGIIKAPMKMIAGVGSEGLEEQYQDFSKLRLDDPFTTFLQYAISPAGVETFVLGGLGHVAMAAPNILDLQNSDSFQNASIANLLTQGNGNLEKRAEQVMGSVNTLYGRGMLSEQEHQAAIGKVGQISSKLKDIPVNLNPQIKSVVTQNLIDIDGLRNKMETSTDETMQVFYKKAISEKEKVVQNLIVGKEPVYFIGQTSYTKEALTDILSNPEIISSLADQKVNINILNDDKMQKTVNEAMDELKVNPIDMDQKIEQVRAENKEGVPIKLKEDRSTEMDLVKDVATPEQTEEISVKHDQGYLKAVQLKDMTVDDAMAEMRSQGRMNSPVYKQLKEMIPVKKEISEPVFSIRKETSTPGGPLFQQLKQGAPNITYKNITAEELMTKRQDSGIRFSKKDGTPYGYFDKASGEIHINEAAISQADALEEFGHLWLETLKKKDRLLYNKAAKSIVGQRWYQEVKNNPDYAGLSEEDFKNEALAKAIAAQATETNNGWLKNLWEDIKNMIRKTFGISKTVDLNNFSLNDLVNKAAGELKTFKPWTLATSEQLIKGDIKTTRRTVLFNPPVLDKTRRIDDVKESMKNIYRKQFTSKRGVGNAAMNVKEGFQGNVEADKTKITQFFNNVTYPKMDKALKKMSPQKAAKTADAMNQFLHTGDPTFLNGMEKEFQETLREFRMQIDTMSDKLLSAMDPSEYIGTIDANLNLYLQKNFEVARDVETLRQNRSIKKREAKGEVTQMSWDISYNDEVDGVMGSIAGMESEDEIHPVLIEKYTKLIDDLDKLKVEKQKLIIKQLEDKKAVLENNKTEVSRKLLTQLDMALREVKNSKKVRGAATSNGKMSDEYKALKNQAEKIRSEVSALEDQYTPEEEEIVDMIADAINVMEGDAVFDYRDTSEVGTRLLYNAVQEKIRSKWVIKKRIELSKYDNNIVVGINSTRVGDEYQVTATHKDGSQQVMSGLDKKDLSILFGEKRANDMEQMDGNIVVAEEEELIPTNNRLYQSIVNGKGNYVTTNYYAYEKPKYWKKNWKYELKKRLTPDGQTLYDVAYSYMKKQVSDTRITGMIVQKTGNKITVQMVNSHGIRGTRMGEGKISENITLSQSEWLDLKQSNGGFIDNVEFNKIDRLINRNSGELSFGTLANENGGIGNYPSFLQTSSQQYMFTMNVSEDDVIGRMESKAVVDTSGNFMQATADMGEFRGETLKRKENYTEAEQLLKGIIVDPRLTVEKTLLSQSMALQNMQLLNRLAKENGLFTKNPKGMISAYMVTQEEFDEAYKGMSPSKAGLVPITGEDWFYATKKQKGTMYMTKEAYALFFPGPKKQLNGIIKTYYTLQSIMKFNYTAGNIMGGGAPRNTISSSWLYLRGGGIRPDKIFKSTSVIMSDFYTDKKKLWNVSKGIFGTVQNAPAMALHGIGTIFNKKSIEELQAEKVELISRGLIQGNIELKTSEKLMDKSLDWQEIPGVKQLTNVASQYYGVSDDIGRVATYYNQLSSLKKANKWNEENGKVVWSLDEMKSMAETYAKDAFPTYSRLPQIFNALSVVPIVGASFAKFTASIHLTTYNIFKAGAQEVTSGNPVLARAGWTKLGMFGATTAILPFIAVLVAAGTGWDREKFLAWQRMQPWYRKNTMPIFLDGPGGVSSSIDLSYIDPSSPYHKIVLSALTSDNFIDGMFNAAKAGITDQFLFQDIVANSVKDIVANKNGYGGNIYSADEDNPNSYFDQASYKSFVYGLQKAFAPQIGTVDKFEKTISGEKGSGGQEYTPELLFTNIVAGAGWRKQTYEAMLKNKLYDVKSKFESPGALESKRRKNVKSGGAKGITTEEYVDQGDEYFVEAVQSIKDYMTIGHSWKEAYSVVADVFRTKEAEGGLSQKSLGFIFQYGEVIGWAEPSEFRDKKRKK